MVMKLPYNEIKQEINNLHRKNMNVKVDLSDLAVTLP